MAGDDLSLMDAFKAVSIEDEDAIHFGLGGNVTTAPLQNQIVGYIFISITIVGLLANGVVFFVIFGASEITKTVTAIYVVQLAIADSLFLIILPLFATQQIYHTWSAGEALCKICNAVKYLNYYAGILFLTAMSVDRYVAVAYSTRARQLRTVKRTLFVCLFVWIVSAIASLPALIFAEVEDVVGDPICQVMFPGYKRINSTFYEVIVPPEYESSLYEYYQNTENVPSSMYYKDGENSSSYYRPEVDDDVYGNENFSSSHFVCKHQNQGFGFYVNQVVMFIAGYVIPFVIICVSYSLIVKKLRESNDNLGAKSRQSSNSTKRRVTRMVVALVICFSVCWLPYHILALLLIPGFNTSSTSQCYYIGKSLIVLGYSNCVFNPLLYTFLGHNFRKRLNDSWKKTRNRVMQQGSRIFVSGHRKSSKFQSCHISKRSTLFMKKSAAQHDHATTANEGEMMTYLITDNPALQDGTKSTLLDLQPIAETCESL